MNTVPGPSIESAMPSADQKKKAEAFRALHSREEPLLLVNVWDVASARIIEAAGSPAIATTSAGIAFAHGYPDGQEIPPELMFAAVAQIANAVKAPVTADVEAGYGTTPESAARTAQSVIEAGAVGMNFEDAADDPARPLVDLSLQLEKIHAIRETAVQLNVPLVLNARTDVYLKEVGDVLQRYDEALRRLSAYRDAGADCVFIPGLSNRDTIRLRRRSALSHQHSWGARSGFGSGIEGVGREAHQSGIGTNASRLRHPERYRRGAKKDRHLQWPAERTLSPADQSTHAFVPRPVSNSILIGVISDTHGLLRPEAVAALRGSERIVHAGDVGNPEILDQLAAIAPVTAVRGNIDKGTWARRLPETELVEIFSSISIYVLHNIALLDLKPQAAGFMAVIYGHSHVPKQEMRAGVLFFNPGSAGPKRFRLPVTIGRLHITAEKLTGEIVKIVD